jgi:large repetitive protein
MATTLLRVVVGAAALVTVAYAQWDLTARLSVARTGHTATLLRDGRVLVAGGSPDRGATCINTAEVYNPATGLWTPTSPMRAARCEHTATLTDDGTDRVVVTGGRSGNATVTVFLATIEFYDPATNTWTTDSLDNMRSARAAHTATLMERGDILVTGGYDGSGFLTSAEQYRVDTPLTPWNPVGDLKVARAYHTADLLPNGRVLLIGGTTTGNVATDTAEYCSNQAFCTWVRTTNEMEVPRTGHASTVLKNGDVLVTGGFVDGEADNSAEVFDNTRFSYTVNGLATPRARHAAVTLADGRVIVVGGVTGTGDTQDTVDFYNPDNRIWTRGGFLTVLNVGRAGHTATLLRTGRVLVAGGDNSTTALGSAEVSGLLP